MNKSVPCSKDSLRILPFTLALLGLSLTIPEAKAVGEPIASRSTNIAINADGSRLINLNQDSDSVSIFRVNPSGAGQNALTKLAEVKVGDEPHCVVIHPTKAEAYVTTADGFVSVIALSTNKVVKTIAVKSEPRGCALTPTGNLLYVANHTHGSVSVINTTSRLVVATTGQTFGRPWAVTVSNDGDDVDTDERVFVTDFFAEVIPPPGGRARSALRHRQSWSGHLVPGRRFQTANDHHSVAARRLRFCRGPNRILRAHGA